MLCYKAFYPRFCLASNTCVMNELPTPHGDKLKALILNEKLPLEDQPRVRQAIERYEKWLQGLRNVQGSYPEIVAQIVSLLNAYKKHIEVDLIFDSDQDFLYRQIDEIIILRKAKRLPSNVRVQFNTRAGRRENRAMFVEHLESHPFSVETFTRFLACFRHLNVLEARFLAEHPQQVEDSG
jgi:hypothetical protein